MNNQAASNNNNTVPMVYLGNSGGTSSVQQDLLRLQQQQQQEQQNQHTKKKNETNNSNNQQQQQNNQKKKKSKRNKNNRSKNNPKYNVSTTQKQPTEEEELKRRISEMEYELQMRRNHTNQQQQLLSSSNGLAGTSMLEYHQTINHLRHHHGFGNSIVVSGISYNNLVNVDHNSSNFRMNPPPKQVDAGGVGGKRERTDQQEQSSRKRPQPNESSVGNLDFDSFTLFQGISEDGGEEMEALVDWSGGGITNNIPIPKPTIDEILEMGLQDCKAQLNKINESEKKLPTSGNLGPLQVRLIQFYYPSAEGVQLVYLPSGKVGFTAVKLDNYRCQVTMIDQSTKKKPKRKANLLLSMQDLGVGSIIISINKEPLTSKYPHWNNKKKPKTLMDMACKLFNGEETCSSPKVLEVIPASVVATLPEFAAKSTAVTPPVPTTSTVPTPSAKSATADVLPTAKSTEGASTQGVEASKSSTAAVTPEDKQMEESSPKANTTVPTSIGNATALSPLRTHSNVVKDATKTSPLRAQESDKEVVVVQKEADDAAVQSLKADTTNQGSVGNKENGVGSDNNETVGSTDDIVTNSTRVTSKLSTWGKNCTMTLEEKCTDAMANALSQNIPLQVDSLIVVAKEEINELKGSSNESLLAEKSKAEADKKRFEKKMETYVQDAMELDNVDENGKADMRGNKNYEACEKKVNELKGKLSDIEVKLKQDKMVPLITLKAKFDKKYEEHIDSTKEWWTEKRNDEPTFLDFEKTKWNDFWARRCREGIYVDD